MTDTKPKGTYRCVVCEGVYDGSKLYLDPMSTATRYTCGDVFCGANVRKISDLSPEDYRKELEDKEDKVNRFNSGIESKVEEKEEVKQETKKRKSWFGLKRFRLPGAKKFSRYLEYKLGGNLTAKGPEVLDWSYGMDYTKKWDVFQNGEKIGEYLIFGPKPGEGEYVREFRGRIPGYVNECVVISNKYKTEKEKKTPEDTVSLVFANKNFVNQDIHVGPGEIVETPWQRQDGHNSIQFP